MKQLQHWPCCLAISICLVAPCRAADSTAKDVFERRILPIFNSPNPSSCTECHLAGVDLKNYILPAHVKSFLSLRDQGLIDVENLADPKILT